MVWTRFYDMHTGGYQKERWQYIYIEAPQKEAVQIFSSRFGHNPYRVSCTCCGEDYNVFEDETLEEATSFERGCAHGANDEVLEEQGPFGYIPYTPLDEFIAQPDVLVIEQLDVLVIRANKVTASAHEDEAIQTDRN